MQKKKAFLLIVTVLFGCFVTAFFFIDAKRSKDFTKGMFPLWDGSAFMLIPPYGSEAVCIIQCEPMQSEWKGEKVSSQGPLWNYMIKSYSDKYEIQQILDRLHNPEMQTPSTVEAGQCLLVVFISHQLNSQSTIRIPFRLDDEGYAVTPRGKDRKLYKILKGGLEEWHAGQTAQRERDRAQALLFSFMQSVEKRLRETLSEDQYMAIINKPLPFSTEEFKAFLMEKQEDPNAILSILKESGEL